MTNSTIFVVIAIMALIAFTAMRQKSLTVVSGATDELHSLPRYHGYFAALMVLLPSLFILFLW